MIWSTSATQCAFNAFNHLLRSLDSLVYIASQISTGMQHLESLGIVHGDLAARNCLVGRQLEVKVGDLGPSRQQYASDYVTLSDGRVLPLRWRAPEALFTVRTATGFLEGIGVLQLV